MIKILRYLKKREWLQVAACLVLIFAQVFLDLKMPDYMSEITILIRTPGNNAAAVWLAGGKMLLCALGSLATSVCVGFFAARVAAAFSRDMRERLFNRVESFSLSEINKFSTASLITRSTNDIQQVQMVLAMGLQAMIKAPILAVWAILKISGKSWEWTLTTACAVAFMMVIMLITVLFAMPRFKKMQFLTDNLNRVTRENLTGVRVVRAYNAERYQEQKFEQANQELGGNLLAATRVMAVLNPGVQLVMSGMPLAIYWIGAALINAAGMVEKEIIFSNMVVFSSYAMQVVMAFMLLAMIYIMLPRASVAARRICEVLDTEPTVLDGAGASPDPEKRGEVEFRHVSFRYPDAQEPVLHDISFTARAGETVAFIGSTGSGKSTIVNLVPRFYDASEGEVLVDGADVRDYSLTDLRNRLGYISQRAVMFSGSVESNVVFGDNGRAAPTDDQVRRAVRIAQASEFVEKMPMQYQAPIAQGGTNVSGGQRQRLSIARAVCRDPEIYIFDDSFSALDYRTDQSLREALRRETAGATCLIVAQRIGTIRDADKIVVLDEGRAVGIGTHRELMRNCEVYREIAYSQLSEEELKDA